MQTDAAHAIGRLFGMMDLLSYPAEYEPSVYRSLNVVDLLAVFESIATQA